MDSKTIQEDFGFGNLTKIIWSQQMTGYTSDKIKNTYPNTIPFTRAYIKGSRTL